MTDLETPKLHDRILGCLLGGAIGDAWGGSCEGALPQESVAFPASGRLSDDTQLTTATCESVTERTAVEPAYIAGRFRAWFEAGRLHGLGASTMKALRDLGAGAHWALAGAKGERAAGNGAAMRIAPLAFVLDPVIEADRTLIRDVCRITHHHDEAYAGALAVLVAIRLMLFGCWQPEQENLLGVVASTLPDSQVRDRLLRYRGLPAGTLPREVADRWGSSGFVAESVPLALFAAQSIAGQPFETVIGQAVAAGGDTDTVASIAGQIAGARVGIGNLPLDLIARIKEVDQTLRVAEDFATTVGRMRDERGLGGLQPGREDDYHPSDEVEPRWETGTSIEKLTARFALPTEPGMQDWAVQVANPDLIDLLLVAYADPCFDDDDHFALMALLVASLDEAKSEGRAVDQQWARTADILNSDAHVHAYTMAYWSRGEDPDPEHHFSITPEIRTVWAKLRASFVG